MTATATESNSFSKGHTSDRQKGTSIMLKFNRVFWVVLCVGILTIVLGCADTQNRESTGQYVDDSVMTAKVKAAIFREGSLETLRIKVKTFKAVVQLSGFVESLQSVDRAEEVAASVAGVVSVENDLVIKDRNFKSQI